MAITVSGLTKRYRGTTAVDDISFEVDDGQIFAFLGTNGAGKSTTIGCLTTTMAFDRGAIRVAGHDVISGAREVREQVGVVFQDSLLDPTLTVSENLMLRASFNHLDRKSALQRITELADLIELDDILGRRYGQLSGGQSRRVDIARALLHRPRILFLDEPTAGLDPASRAAVWHAITGLRRTTGLTVFLTTHYMEETEEADRVCVIDRGRIIADDTPALLRAVHSRSVLTVTSADPAALFQLAADHGAVPEQKGDVIDVPVDDAAAARAMLAQHGDLVRDFEFRHGRMDDVFLALTGRSGTQPAALIGAGA